MKSDSPQAAPSTDAGITLRFGMYSVVVLLAFFLINAAAIFLPQDKFLRYQAPIDPQSPMAPWIYERIHFDSAPIDIAFIGTSRTGLSLHTRRLEQDLADRGIAAKAANLFIVRSGVNMQYVLAKELLDSRRVKLLVIEITEREERKPHEDFVYLADPVDVFTAPLAVNFNYLSDLTRLPGRQVELFWRTETDDTPFSLANYQGSNYDHAEVIRTIDGKLHYRDASYSLAEMEKMRQDQDRLVTPPLLPAALGGVEYRLPRYYERRMLDLAASRGTRVLFLYTPRYKGPSTPASYAMYEHQAALINPWPIVQDYQLWWDASHLNWEGAKRLTDFVAAALATAPELQSNIKSR